MNYNQIQRDYLNSPEYVAKGHVAGGYMILDIYPADRDWLTDPIKSFALKKGKVIEID